MAFVRWVALLGLQGMLVPLYAQALAWPPAGPWSGFRPVPAARGAWSAPEARLWIHQLWYCRTLEAMANLERQHLLRPGPALAGPPPPHWQPRPGPRRSNQPDWNLVVEVKPIGSLDGGHSPAGSFR